jgi:hypothetical protein
LRLVATYLPVLSLLAHLALQDAAIAQSEHDAVLRFAVIGDYGWCATGTPPYCAAQEKVAALVNSWQPDVVLTTGDNNYPHGELDTWRVNGTFYDAYTSTGRFRPVIGNHDYHCEECPDAYVRIFGRGLTGQFALPSESVPLARYFMLDSNQAGKLASEVSRAKAARRSPISRQRAWLMRAHRLPACWKLVFMHHPPYSSGSHHGQHSSLQPGAGWNYAEWGIDAVFSGHEHNYESIVRDGIYYFVNGSGGAPLYPLPIDGIDGSRARVSDEHGAQLVTVTRSELRADFWSVHLEDPLSVPWLRDRVIMRKDCGDELARGLSNSLSFPTVGVPARLERPSVGRLPATPN